MYLIRACDDFSCTQPIARPRLFKTTCPATGQSLVYSLRLLKSDCPTIPILSGLSRFFLKIPNPDQYAIGIGKIPNSTRVVIFSSNLHKRKQNAEYLTLMSWETEETARNIDRNCYVRTPEMSFPGRLNSRFKNFLGAFPQIPIAKGAFSASDSIFQKFLSRFKALWRLDSLLNYIDFLLVIVSKAFIFHVCSWH